MSNLSAVTDDSFDTDVLQAEIPVLVDFWAEWCGPCQRLTPILEEVANDFAGKLKIVKMNIEENTQTPAKFAVRGIPTLLIFKGGKLLSTKVGFLSKTQLSEFLNSQL